MSADEWVARVPHPALRPLVTRYVGYVQHSTTPSLHRGLPSGHLTFIVSLREPIRLVGMPAPGQSPGAFPGLVAGMHLAPALIAQDPVQAGVSLELSPLGARALLGVSPAELAGQVVHLAELGSPELTLLPERLAEAPDWPRRFAILDQVMRAQLTQAPEPAPEVRWAWHRVLQSGGTVPVASLAREVGWSRRHFGERFARELGLAPKQAARVVRFERTGRLLRRSGPVRLAELAIACGYYDQAHLTNEWRALAGCSPGTWIAEELPFLQGKFDTDGAD
ncbi:helix-turn-helix domain-containing protein [Saccharomonospora sp. NPDC046836]|uniref:helix-turn-helix domain-containing protein n=1 Tax=Saccharomonospora sp. NPDC046836 TaxID=3156921 RepID=UPI0033EE2E91